ncbi:MAG: tetratricopeptide repeat protein [Actinobacteria bacterium]|nr:tetratricopeptide repeat protein [Actinomycetota bacterium]
MDHSSAPEAPVPPVTRKKRSKNRTLIAAILAVGVLSLSLLGLMLWTVLGSQTEAPRSAAERDVALAEAAVEADPNNPAARVDAARINLLAGDYDRAIEYADSAIKLSPELASAELVKGYAYAAKGDEAAARELYEKVAKGETNTAAEALLALAIMDKKAGSLESAIESLEKAIEIDSMDALKRVELGKIQVAAAKPAEALASYASALRLVPDLEEGLEALREMQYGPAEYLLAQMAWEQGDRDEATRLMENAVEVSPDMAWLHVALGDFRAMQGDTAGAKTAYTNALGVDSSNQDAKDALAALER